MLINPLLKTRKPRQFEYKPRFYDPDKEELENRKREVLGHDYKKKYDDPDSRSEGIHLRRGIVADRQKKEHKMTSSITRLIIALMLLVLFTLWLYN